MAIWRQKHPNVAVDVRYGGTVEAKLIADMAAGTQSDVVLYSAAGIAALREQFVDLLPLIRRDKVDLKDFTPVHPALLTQNGQFGMPFQESMYSWYMNRTMFQKMGMAPPTEQWTWNEVADAARKLTKPGEQQWGLEIVPPMSRVIFTELLLSNGGNVIDKDLKRTTLNTPEATEAGRWLADRLLRDRTVVTTDDRKAVVTSGLSNAFQTGRVAMLHVNVGWVGNLESSIGFGQFEWDVMPTPRAPRTNKEVNIVTDQPHAITKNSRRSAGQTDAAWALVAFLSGPDLMAMIAEQRTAFPVHRKVLSGDRYLRRPPASMPLVPKLIDNGRFEPTFKGSDDWYATLWKRLDEVWAGTTSVDDGLRAAQAEGDGKLASLPH